MKFDPITGEPIEESSSATGQQSYEGFEETAPLYEEPAYGAPETAPLYEEPAYNSQPSYGYEQQDYSQQDYNQANYGYEQPVYAQPMKPKASWVKWLVPGAIGVAAVAAVIIVAVVSGVFLSPSQKVALAATNTFKEAGLIGDMITSLGKVGESDKSTTYVMIDAEGTTIEGEYRHTKGDKQLWVLADVSEMPEIEGTLTLTKKEVQLYAPIAGDYLFLYNYVDENDGDLIDELPDEAVEAINKALAELYRGENSKVTKNLKKDIEKWWKEIEVEEVDKEEYEINGKDVDCVGYEMVIDEDVLADLIDILTENVVAYMEEEDFDEIDPDDFEDAMDEMKDSLDGMPKFVITTYVDSNKLAAIVMEAKGEDGKIEILFEGGDYRAQNVTVEVNGDEVFKIEGEVDGDEETMEFILCNYGYYNYETDSYEEKDYTVAEYEYDRKSGDFEITIPNNYDEEATFTIEGNIKCDNNGVVITDGEMKNGYGGLDFEFSCKKGAKIEKLKGEKFDIGNADMDDIEDILEDIQDELE